MISHIIEGDCLEALRGMGDSSVDAIVCDPPYGLSSPIMGDDMVGVLRTWLGVGQSRGAGFMGKKWDAMVPSPDVWAECLRVLKPGGHALVFGGTRTYDLMVLSMRIAGFEIRDQLAWMYGSGFPKSLDVAKQDGCEQWSGRGTALKPAQEPIVLARKPLIGTVAANVLTHGTGGINIDGCRIETSDNLNGGAYSDGWRGALAGDEREGAAAGMYAEGGGRLPGQYVAPAGRWPANVLFDEAAAEALDAQTGDKLHGASRFFYCAKASRAEREAGLEHLPLVRRTDGREKDHQAPNLRTTERRNHHPTVKPLALMRYLCKLITPPGGVILDPYAGSGTTGCAAKLEGFGFIGLELEAEYCAIARARIGAV